MKKLAILLGAMLLTCALLRANVVTDDPGTIKVQLVPYYDFQGQVVKLPHYSEGLASSDEKVVLATIAEMRKQWQSLTVTEMYVAAIRLYDLGYRKEGVYWFFSAEFRGRLFAGLIDQDKIGDMGDPGFEEYHAIDAFYELTSPYFDGYAFGDSKWATEILQKVQKEVLTIPDFKAAYPGVAFKDVSQWKDLDLQLHDAMNKLLDYVNDKQEEKTRAEDRVKSGYDAAFSKLTNKDLPAQ